MKPIHIFFYGLVGMGLSACSTSPNKADIHSETETAKTINAPRPSIKPKVSLAMLAKKADLVCGMGLTDESMSDTTVYEQKIYGFCSAECKAAFRNSPTTYLTQK